MPSVVASILVRIMENTNVGGGNMDELRGAIAGHMTTVASGKLPKRDDKPSRDSDDKPSKGFQQFAQFILSLKPKDAERPMGYTERTKSPAQLIAILSGTGKKVNDQGVTENGIGAQESALRQVGEQCMQFARRRVTDADDQQKHDKEIGELLQTAKLSVAFTQLNAQQQRAMGSRLGQAANVLAKRHNVQARDVTKSALAKSRAGKTISPNLRQKPE